MPPHSRHGIRSDSFSSTSTGKCAYWPDALIDRQGTDFCPNAIAVESLSEMTRETLAESRIEFEEVFVEVICFQSSDGDEIDVISELAERSTEVQQRLENENEEGINYIRANLTSAAIGLSIRWHLYTHRHLGTWDDDSNSIPPVGDDWIRRHFFGLNEALTWELLHAADYFKLRGLFHTIYTTMIPKIPWPWESGNKYNMASYSAFEVSFRSSDGQEIYVISDLAKKSPDAKARVENPPENGIGYIQVNFTSAALQLSITWFPYSQHLLDTWGNDSVLIPPGRDEWIRRNFLGLNEALTWEVLHAADYFKLRGLHRIISNDMRARNLMPRDIVEQY